MKIIDNFLNDVKIIEPSVYSDKRGYFFESWNQQVFNDLLKKDIEFVQDNHSGSVRNIKRTSLPIRKFSRKACESHKRRSF